MTDWAKGKHDDIKVLSIAMAIAVPPAIDGRFPAREMPVKVSPGPRPFPNDYAEDNAMLGRLVAIAGLAAGGYMLKKKMDQASSSKGGSSVEDTIEVDVPVRTAYNQFTQFEDFPEFMESVIQIRQLDDTHLEWRARVAGKEECWQSEITFQIPDKRIAWRSTSGPANSGDVSFEPVSENRTRVNLRMSYRPPGLLEQVGDALGAVELELSRNLQNFKRFIESRQVETGSWRGVVSGDVSMAKPNTGAQTADSETSTVYSNH